MQCSVSPPHLILAGRCGSVSSNASRDEARGAEGSETRSAPVNLNLSTNTSAESQTAAMPTQAGLSQDCAFVAIGGEDTKKSVRAAAL